MEPSYKGAEANLYVADGKLIKERVEKKYRIPELDVRLRRQRTKREARNIERASEAGVRVPKVYRCDESKFTLEMEYMYGPLLKDVFDRSENLPELSAEVGRILRKLHDSGIVHNDLTTSNMILVEGEICVIDFGLAVHTNRLEDKAMDIVVFKKSIQATHTTKADEIWDNLIRGYRPDVETLKRVQAIENRVRYR